VTAEPSTDGMAGATDTTGTPAVTEPYVEEVRPLVLWDKDFVDNDDELYDFRPQPEKLEDEVPVVEEEDPDPKASSALASALAANYEMTRMPDYSPSQESPASADKGSTPPSPPESGTPTSSPKTSRGKTAEPAST
jgi:hypothetical protein